MIDEYISRFPKEVQGILRRIRAIVRAAAPEAEETIKYQIPTFVLHGNLVHFAAFAKHVGLYPTPSAIEHFRDELTSYQHAKGSIQFPLDEPIPYDLIERIVRYRVAENRQSSKKKAKGTRRRKPEG